MDTFRELVLEPLADLHFHERVDGLPPPCLLFLVGGLEPKLDSTWLDVKFLRGFLHTVQHALRYCLVYVVEDFFLRLGGEGHILPPPLSNSFLL